LELTCLIFFREDVPRGILHNPDLYPDPETFNPERFLDKDGRFRDDPTISLAFGGGKRICPGRHLVDAALFIVTVSVLSLFDVTKARDENGHEIPVNPMIDVDSVVWYVTVAAALSILLLGGPLQPSGEV
jgi:cytochrome P450